MTTSSTRGVATTSIVLALAAAVLGAAPSLAAPASLNLAPNPGFEEARTEPAPVPAGTQPQPLLPAGWTFEGSTLLFDHTPNQKHGGKRGAAISGTLSGGKRACDPTINGCVDNPAHGLVSPARDSMRNVWSARPVWRTEKAIPVQGGKTYAFSVWAARPTLDSTKETVGEGAATWVRWLDANGAFISEVAGPASVADGKRQLAWRQAKSNVVAPKNAAGALLLLGTTDWTSFAQVVFDDVHFAEIVVKKPVRRR